MPFAGYKNFADCVKRNSSKKNPQAYCAVIMRKTEGINNIWEADVSTARRKRYADQGIAMPDGSYPIPNVSFLRRAVQAFGRASNKEATKRHIIKRAKALGRTDLLPADWKSSTKKESLMQPREKDVRDVFDAQEAEFNDEEMTAKVTLIRSGRSKNGRNYSPRVLREAVSRGIFNNMRMFLDHSNQLPLKRSIKEMVSATTTTAYEEDEQGGKITSPVKFFNEDFYNWAKRAQGFFGDSISARLRSNLRREPNGSVFEDVQQILRGYSVDWVLYPAAGGGIEAFEAEGDATVADVDWEQVDEDMLKEHAPELYKRLTAAKTESEPPDDGDDDDDESDEGEKVLTKESVKELVTEALSSWATEQADIKSGTEKNHALIAAAPIPDVVKNRLKKQFDGKKFDEKAVKESIADAQEELKSLGLGPKITGMGVTAASSDKKASVGRASEAVAAVFGMDKGKKTDEGEAEK